MNAIEILRATLDLAANARLLHGLLERRHSLVNHRLTLTPLDLYLLHEIVIDLRLHVAERQILQLPFNRINAQAMRQGRVNLQRFARNALLLMHGHILHGAHIMQSVRQLDQHHANVARHRQKHLAIIFDLAVLLGNIFYFTQLRNAVDQIGDHRAEALLDIVQSIIGILDHVMQECRRQGLIVQL